MAWTLMIVGPGGVKAEVQENLERLNLSSNTIQARIAGAVQEQMEELRKKYKKLSELLAELPPEMKLRCRTDSEVKTVREWLEGLKPEHDGEWWYSSKESGERGQAREGGPNTLICIPGVGFIYSEMR